MVEYITFHGSDSGKLETAISKDICKIQQFKFHELKKADKINAVCTYAFELGQQFGVYLLCVLFAAYFVAR